MMLYCNKFCKFCLLTQLVKCWPLERAVIFYVILQATCSTHVISYVTKLTLIMNNPYMQCSIDF